MERKLFFHQMDNSPVSFLQISFKPGDAATRGDEDLNWRPHQWEGDDRPMPARVNAAGVSTMARRIIATEWARARGKSRRSSGGAFNLEKEAEGWKRQTERAKRHYAA